jgi:hypothetical protein
MSSSTRASASKASAGVEGPATAALRGHYNEMVVPALRSDGQRNYGPMLVPAGGSASSQRTRTTPYHDGSIQETQTVTLTISRAE